MVGSGLENRRVGEESATEFDSLALRHIRLHRGIAQRQSACSSVRIDTH
jgi:hypothetical protein